METMVVWALCALVFVIGALCGGVIVSKLEYGRGFCKGYAEGRGWHMKKRGK